VRVKQPECGWAVAGFETLTFAREPVEAVENAAHAAIYAESLIHDFVHERKDANLRKTVLRCTERLLQDSAGIVKE
jgi:hypothetical protein